MDNTWFNGNKSNRCFNQQKINHKDVKSMQGPEWSTDHSLLRVKQKIMKISHKWKQEKLDNPGFTNTENKRSRQNM